MKDRLRDLTTPWRVELDAMLGASMFNGLDGLFRQQCNWHVTWFLRLWPDRGAGQGQANLMYGRTGLGKENDRQR